MSATLMLLAFPALAEPACGLNEYRAEIIDVYDGRSALPPVPHTREAGYHLHD